MTQFLLRFPFCFPMVLATFFGLLFPISTIAFMLWHDSIPFSWDAIFALHEQHYDLAMIWTAPLVLGFFGSYVGRTNWLLKQKMDSLEYQTARLNTILDTAASAIITTDRTGCILSFNRSAERIFGYASKDILGQNVRCLTPPEISIPLDVDLQSDLQIRQSNLLNKPIELSARRQNGEIFPTMLQINPMEIDNELFFCGVIDDISETKTLQNQLIQAQKLEAIGQLASGVAHEINTPIQYVGDNLSALKANFDDIIAYQQALTAALAADDAQQQQLAALVERFDLDFILEDSPKAIQQSLEGIERVAEIVKAMKTFSHVEANQTKQSINLHEALNSALTISRNNIKYVAEVITDFAPDVALIHCYASEMHQVFLNLIINAAHAIEERHGGMGQIRITTRKLDNWIDISFHDNGAGIAPDIQEKVFNLFFTTKAVGKGTGQGLALSHSIVVERHQGKLFFESEPGQGTTFHVQLPLQPN